MLNIQHGGKLLSQGAYGCVYSPSFGKKNRYKYVSKIQKNNWSAANEIVLGQIIKEFPYFNNHFVPVIDSQPIDIKKIEESDKSECDIFIKYKDSDFLNMKIDFVDGVTFLDYIIENKTSDFNFVELLVDSYNHLLDSLSKLAEMKIVHYDLKGNNIMFNLVNKLPLVLDFGLSIDMTAVNSSNIDKYFYVYAPEYAPWCLEIHYLSFLLKVSSNPTDKDLIDMVDKYIDNDTNPVGMLFSNTFVDKFKKSCLIQLRKYKAMDKKDCISYILEQWKTWDNFSLSVIYLSFFYYIYSFKYKKQEFVKIMLEVLLLNIHPNPEKRLSINDTSLIFNNKLLNFVQNVKNVKFISKLNKDFVKNKEGIIDRMNKRKKIMDTQTKKNKINKNK
tara:strand:+ start:848 stop:2011 length:1164 start_codon:yes stop_codon:yes gene_type:complete